MTKSCKYKQVLCYSSICNTQTNLFANYFKHKRMKKLNNSAIRTKASQLVYFVLELKWILSLSSVQSGIFSLGIFRTLIVNKQRQPTYWRICFVQLLVFHGIFYNKQTISWHLTGITSGGFYIYSISNKRRNIGRAT